MKHWITFNEQFIYTFKSYVVGEYAQGRGAEWDKSRYLGGNSATEPYIVGHNSILAHAAAVKVYKTKYQVLFSLFSFFLTKSRVIKRFHVDYVKISL